MQKRKLTISKKYRSTGRFLSKTETVVPEIKLSGKWLAECGFLAGKQVQVVVSNNQLIIQPLKS